MHYQILKNLDTILLFVWVQETSKRDDLWG